MKVAKRKHTIDLLQWLYTRRDPALCGSKLSLEHRRAQAQDTRVLTYGEVSILNRYGHGRGHYGNGLHELFLEAKNIGYM